MAGRAAGKRARGADLLKKARVEERNGKKYYHVTDIISLANPVAYSVSDDELEQYAARGTLVHSEAALLLGKGVDLKEKRNALKTLENGSLGLKAIKKQVIKDFMLKYPEYNWGGLVCEKTLWCPQLSLVGTPDLIGLNKEGVMIVADWKTSSSYPQEVKDKYFKQMAAYAFMWTLAGGMTVEELHILPLNPKNKYGYGKPIATTKVDEYIDLFLKDYKTINPDIT